MRSIRDMEHEAARVDALPAEERAAHDAELTAHRIALGLEDVDVPEIAKSTPYFSGADLKNVTNEAALEAARVGKTQIDMSDFYRALDKITLGLENGSLTISEQEKKAIAYHEAGHAVTAAVIPGSDKLQKVSIIPRGRALGAAFYLPEEQVLMSKERLENQLIVALGGRAAEEVFMGSVTSGAADDFRKATDRKSTRLNSSHTDISRMPSSA